MAGRGWLAGSDRARAMLLVLVTAGTAMAEAAALAAVGATGVLGLAPQISAPVPYGVFHDLRWVFVYHSSWAMFAAETIALIVVRSALNAVIITLAWPGLPGGLARHWGGCSRATRPSPPSPWWCCRHGCAWRSLPLAPPCHGLSSVPGCASRSPPRYPPIIALCKRWARCGGHIFSLMPMRMSQELTGQAVKNPRIIASCIIIQ